jgi:hypothetical protein
MFWRVLSVPQGMYCLTLEFESKLEFQQWEDRLPKIQSFFGPGAVLWTSRPPCSPSLSKWPLMLSLPTVFCVLFVTQGCQAILQT